MKREDAKQLADQAIIHLQQELQAGHSDTLKRFLDTMGRFYDYSFRNCMLIALQMPEASHVAGFQRWLQMGRCVRKGEKAIGILAPMTYRRKEEVNPDEGAETLLRGFKVVNVFDVSQTDGEDLPQFATVHGDTGELLPRLEGLIRSEGIKLTDAKLPMGTEGVSLKGQILIADSLPPAERFAVLAHELAHEWMHDNAYDQQKPRTVRETEAEAVSYVVCRAFGFDCSTRSSDYIQLYQGDQATLAESLQRIQGAATRIIQSLSQTQETAEEGQCHVA
jgi:antirestriction protein ArdC